MWISVILMYWNHIPQNFLPNCYCFFNKIIAYFWRILEILVNFTSLYHEGNGYFKGYIFPFGIWWGILGEVPDKKVFVYTPYSVLEFLRETEPIECIYSFKSTFFWILRSWLMCLWKLRNPTICHAGWRPKTIV